ncbi:hypothetical protein NAT47_10980 [Flavobacterium sp. HXWNR69]|uniref:Tetratricopeptide repeat protein n=1 Tax=Flavobacterium fragile TaxID=2949085 RepID=A0ABT0TK46_9FLAO|nr:hypothetical protein [Flavobacterium sp. HXWNR69]MCL9770941.1 hypothetical protein [Flavobacterium sp. HXWNR69]
MKKLVLSATLLLSVATFAQKDELKTLKKIYSKNAITEKDLENYKLASDALQTLASEESDKVYAKFYKVMYPTVVLASKGEKATLEDQVKLYNPEFIKSYGEVINETLEFEKKSGKKIYTDELIQEKAEFKNGISSFAMNLNNAKKYKEASGLFYSLYLFDPMNEGKSLKNAAILSIQAEDYKLAQKLYEEYLESDYLNKGTTYLAINKANESEEEFNSREHRSQYITLGTHEKPKDVKNSTKKGDVYKILAILYTQNKEIEKAKVAYAEARKLLPNDEELKDGEFKVYYNSAISYLAEEQDIVKEINASRDNSKKYDELMKKRKEIFTKALPDLEKAYSINPNDTNTKSLLKTSYLITDQPEKAKAFN